MKITQKCEKYALIFFLLFVSIFMLISMIILINKVSNTIPDDYNDGEELVIVLMSIITGSISLCSLGGFVYVILKKPEIQANSIELNNIQATEIESV